MNNCDKAGMANFCNNKEVKLVQLRSQAAGGSILGVTQLHIVQDIGHDAVVYRQAYLNRIPTLEEKINIKYKNGRGAVEPQKNIVLSLSR